MCVTIETNDAVVHMHRHSGCVANDVVYVGRASTHVHFNVMPSTRPSCVTGSPTVPSSLTTRSLPTFFLLIFPKTLRMLVFSSRMPA